MTRTPSGRHDPSTETAVHRLDPDSVRRRELSAFLRSRRERISPGQAGMPVGGRRRTPGLRREEVAQLAGVGVTWYTWLEQGRDIRASEQVLHAIARVLHLDPDEQAHLLTLAGASTAPSQTEVEALGPATQRLLDQVHPFPACVQTAKYDLLGYNRTYGRLVHDMDALAPENRNCMYLTFTDPRWRSAVVDWDVAAARMVAQFRAHMAEHVAEPAWKSMLKRLKASSPEFVRLWEQHEVAGTTNLRKQFRNPQVGLLSFEVSMTWLQPRQGVRLLVYTPADAQTERRIGELADLIAQPISA